MAFVLTRYSTWDVFPLAVTARTASAHTNGSIITIGEYHSNFPVLYTEETYDLDGNNLSTPVSAQPLDEFQVGSHTQASMWCSNYPFLFGWQNPGAGSLNTGWFYQENMVQQVSTAGGTQYNPLGGTSVSDAAFNFGFLLNNHIYTTSSGFVSGNSVLGISRWPVSGNVPAATADMVYNLDPSINAANLSYGTDVDNIDLYVINSGASGSTTRMYRFSQSLVLLDTWAHNELPSTFTGNREFFVWNEHFIVGTGASPSGRVRAYYLPTITSSSSSVSDIAGGFYPVPQAAGQLYLGNNYGITQDGVYTLAVTTEAAWSSSGLGNASFISTSFNPGVWSSAGVGDSTWINSSLPNFMWEGSGSANWIADVAQESVWNSNGAATVSWISPTSEYYPLAPICDICGFRYPSKVMKKRWDGLWSCPYDYEPRHISDFYKHTPRPVLIPPYIRPEFTTLGNENVIIRAQVTTTTVDRRDFNETYLVWVDLPTVPHIAEIKIYVNDILAATGTSFDDTSPVTVTSTNSLQELGLAPGIYPIYATVRYTSGAMITSVTTSVSVV